VCGFANSVIILLKTLAVFFFLKLGKLDNEVILDLRTLVKNVTFFSRISPAMMHAMIVGCSGATVMNLTVTKETKQVEKQWRQQVVMKTEPKFTVLNVLI